VPFAYGALQILGEAATKTGGLDNEKIAKYIHAHEFNTVAGPISFTADGEWTKNRMVTIQFQGITSGSVEEFKDPKKVVMLYPDKEGKLIAPYDASK
jgi:branched-chain amino acid transport system substrate-binding protein